MTTLYHTSKTIQQPLFVLSEVCETPVTSTRICKVCEIEQTLDNFQKLAQGRLKTCRTCMNDKKRAEYQSKDKEELALERHEHYLANRETILEKSKAYGKANKDRIVARNTARYQSDAKVRQHHSEYQSQWNAEHPEVGREYQRRRRKANPHENTANTMRYNARKKTQQVDKVDYAFIRERDGDYCYICEKNVLPHHKLEFDHRIPLTRNGPHAEENIFISHRCCNRRKHNKLLEEMTQYSRRGPDDMKHIEKRTRTA